MTFRHRIYDRFFWKLDQSAKQESERWIKRKRKKKTKRLVVTIKIKLPVELGAQLFQNPFPT